MMKSAFNPALGTWEIGWPERVSKHDVVYESPPCDPMQGMPIGNGDVGVLCWCEDTRIILAVNKCDLWDDAAFERFHNWKPEEEDYSTALRHACRIVIDFQLPVFDLFYLSGFQGRISLADASLNFTLSGPLGSVTFSAFVSHDEGVICCEAETSFTEDVPVQIRIERYGSRTFGHWYTLVNQDASIGLAGASSAVDEDGMYVAQQLSSGRFAAACRVTETDGLSLRYTRLHSRASVASLTGSAKKRFAFMAIVTEPVESDPIQKARERLDAGQQSGSLQLQETHQQAWKRFWMRSLMECGDDYLDNLWHLTMYYANASQRGRYPGRFINGLWSWNRDAQPWTFYFHWNQQQTYWPLNAAGHHDLLDSYLDYRFNSLPAARKDARDLFKTDGAVVSDVTERRGYNSVSEFANHTPIAQIALDFWRQHLFTGDMSFLKERALPYLLEAARFFESLFEKDDDGIYHAREGTGYEGWIKLRDGISEVACAKALFSAALEALREAGVEEPRAARWLEITDNLVPLPTIVGGDSLLGEENGSLRYRRGFFRGEAAPSDTILSAGFGIEQNRLMTSKVPSDEMPALPDDLAEIIVGLESNETPYSSLREDMKVNDGIFPAVEYSAIFPSGLIGVSLAGTELFNAAVNTVKLYAPDCTGWDPLPIAMARLGLSTELHEILSRWPARYQIYPNGFGHWGVRDIMRADSAVRFRVNLVRGISPPEGESEPRTFHFPTWNFRHTAMEAMSVLACAMNESLLQSHDGILRVAPAAIPLRDGRFTLHGAGGFVVFAEIRLAEPLWIAVESRLGKSCRVENPWPIACLYHNGALVSSQEGRVVEFSTVSGSRYLLVPEPGIVESWTVEPVSYQRNSAPKKSPYGKAFLGLPRMF